MHKKDAWLEINLDNIRHNVNLVKNYVGGKAKILAIVKADAYGHGFLEVAKVLADEGIEYLGLTNLKESYKIRDVIPEISILNVSHANPEEYRNLSKKNIEQMVASFEEAKSISDNTEGEVSIHINIDTGMGRTGFLPKENFEEEILKIRDLKNIKIKGLMTHLSCSEIKNEDYNMRQLEIFKNVLKSLKSKGLEFEIIHVANTGAISRFGKPYYDMLRAGMLLYGVIPDFSVEFETMGFKEAMELKARIMNIRTLPEGSHIGYDASYVTSKEEKIATLNIGYYDGIYQHINRDFKVIVNGVFCPIIGLICLNNCMIDVSEVEDVKIGDTVTFIGKDKEKFNSIHHMAKAQNMYSLELCCRISARVPRIYIGKK